MVFGASVTIEDALGASVEIKLPIQKIIPMNSDSLEVLRILKAENRVVGVYSGITRERSFWGNLAEKPKVGRWNELNLEAIADLGPDLVITYGYNTDPFIEKKLKAFGIQLLYLDFYKIDTLEREVMVLGKLLGQESEAARFCDWDRRNIDMIRGIIDQTAKRPKVYIENYTGYQTVSTGTGGNEMCMLAGGKNIAAGLSIPYPRVTPEWVVSENPEVIIKMAASDGYALKDATTFNRLRDAIMKRPGWRHITAVASGNVHVIDGAISAGPRAIIGIAYMARWLHPKLFQNIDPKAMHKEYLNMFQGMTYQGKFVSDDLDLKETVK